jgi:hypothetical protein
MKARKKRRTKTFIKYLRKVLYFATPKEAKKLEALTTEAFDGIFAKDREVAWNRFFAEGDRILYKAIFKDMRPKNVWKKAKVTPGKFEESDRVGNALDRFRKIFPNTTKVWNANHRTGYYS